MSMGLGQPTLFKRSVFSCAPTYSNHSTTIVLHLAHMWIAFWVSASPHIQHGYMQYTHTHTHRHNNFQVPFDSIIRLVAVDVRPSIHGSFSARLDNRCRTRSCYVRLRRSGSVYSIKR